MFLSKFMQKIKEKSHNHFFLQISTACLIFIHPETYRVAEALIYCTMSGGAAISYAPDYEKGKIAAARIFQLLDFTPVISRFSPNITLVISNVEFKYF